MTTSAHEALAELQKQLTPAEGDNRLVPVIAAGEAPRSVLAALAAEEHHIVASDLRSFLTLAARTTSNAAASDFCQNLATGERIAQRKLADFAAACGLNDVALAAYEPLAGCQAYPSYVARLTMDGDPGSTILAMVANFAEWGEYCGTIAQALRVHYGFDDRACGFFDFFATPAPHLVEQALTAVQAYLDRGQPVTMAARYGRLLRDYELMFWDTLADQKVDGG